MSIHGYERAYTGRSRYEKPPGLEIGGVFIILVDMRGEVIFSTGSNR